MELTCKYCSSLRKNANSLRQHECRCKENPNRVVQKISKETSIRWKIEAIERQKMKRRYDIVKYYKNPKVCDNCNKFHKFDQRNGVFCSASCAANHSNLNREYNEWNDESKRKASNAQIIEQARRNNVKFQKACENHDNSKLFWNLCECGNLKIENKENKECYYCRCSKSQKKAYKNGSQYVAGGTAKWLDYKGIKVQGSYELRMCHILDEMKGKNEIENWEYTNDRFEYVGVDDKTHNYLMDFKVFKENSFYYVETKGYMRENDELKWKAVRDLGYRLDVLFNEDIEKLEADVDKLAKSLPCQGSTRNGIAGS